MGTETERKFLVISDAFRPGAESTHIRQGYVHNTVRCGIRVRITDDEAFLTVKGASRSASRTEFEYPIPLDDAVGMLREFCDAVIEKRRFYVPFKGYVWEVDVFGGANQGLVLAEIELPEEDAEFEIPDWIGREVTFDPRYLNAALIRHPWLEWEENKEIANGNWYGIAAGNPD